MASLMNIYTTVFIILLQLTNVFGISINCDYEEDQLTNDEKRILDSQQKILKIMSLCRFKSTQSTLTEVTQFLLRNQTVEAVASFGQNAVEQLWTSNCSNRQVNVYGHPLEIQQSKGVMLVYNQITHFKDDYFCRFMDLIILNLANNMLNDVTKLGFNSSDGQRCCGCRLRILTLSNNQLSVIKNESFDQLEQLVILRLDNCLIERIEADALKRLKSLKVLDLSVNNIMYLSSDIFRENTNLRTLKLRGNMLGTSSLWTLRPLSKLSFLDLNDNRIESLSNQQTVFDSLIELKGLNIRNNSLSSLDNELLKLSNLKGLDLGYNQLSNISENSLSGLKSLCCLILDNNRLSVVPNIRNLFQLKSLEMSNNSLSSLQRSDFINVTNLISVGLESNNINVIERGTFDETPLLKRLSLRENVLRDIHRVFDRSSIDKIYLDNNKLVQLSFADFSTRLVLLSAKNNLISTLNWTDFENTFQYVSGETWSLKRIMLNDNQLSTLTNFFIPPSVKKFEAKDNFIRNISYHPQYQQWLDSSMTKLKTVFLQNNNFSVLPESPVFIVRNDLEITPKYFMTGNPLQCSCENSWIKNRSIAIDDVFSLDCTPLPKSMSSYEVTNLLKLNTSELFCKSNYENDNRCDYDYSVDGHFASSTIKCKFYCPYLCSCYSTANFSIIELDCSNSSLQSIPKFTNDDGNLENSILTLWLDGNNFTHINSSDFASVETANRLYLSRSNVVTIDINAFNGLTSMEILHLDDNRIQTLPTGLFDHLHQLRELHLNNNHLKFVADDIFYSLSLLQILKLHHNHLSNFSVWTLTQLKSLTDVTLHQNPWTCECGFVDKFLIYLQNHSQVIRNEDELFCTEINGTEIPLINFNSSRCYSAEAIVSSSMKTFVLIGALLLIVCVMLVMLLMFYFRHEMQVILYSRYGWRIFNRGRENNQNKIYDAFIAYNGEDVDFLFYDLLPNLEQIDRPFRLCIHERDFALGAFITDSILEAVEVSARTIVLLTENFVKSNWCCFEFKTAHVQMLNDRCARLLVIVVGDIPDDIDPEIKMYLKTNTYLKWGEKMFWKKLYFAMPERRVWEPDVDGLPMTPATQAAAPREATEITQTTI